MIFDKKLNITELFAVLVKPNSLTKVEIITDSVIATTKVDTTISGIDSDTGLYSGGDIESESFSNGERFVNEEPFVNSDYYIDSVNTDFYDLLLTDTGGQIDFDRNEYQVIYITEPILEKFILRVSYVDEAPDLDIYVLDECKDNTFFCLNPIEGNLNQDCYNDFYNDGDVVVTDSGELATIKLSGEDCDNKQVLSCCGTQFTPLYQVNIVATCDGLTSQLIEYCVKHQNLFSNSYLDSSLDRTIDGLTVTDEVNSFDDKYNAIELVTDNSNSLHNLYIENLNVNLVTNQLLILYYRNDIEFNINNPNSSNMFTISSDNSSNLSVDSNHITYLDRFDLGNSWYKGVFEIDNDISLTDLSVQLGQTIYTTNNYTTTPNRSLELSLQLTDDLSYNHSDTQDEPVQLEQICTEIDKNQKKDIEYNYIPIDDILIAEKFITYQNDTNIPIHTLTVPDTDEVYITNEFESKLYTGSVIEYELLEQQIHLLITPNTTINGININTTANNLPTFPISEPFMIDFTLNTNINITFS